MARVYLDSAPVIYLVEQVQPYVELVRTRLSGQDVQVVASHLTRLECRVKPLRDRDEALLRNFDRYFDAAVAEVVELSRAVVDLATNIRAEYRFSTPDAIHLAAALWGRCDIFLTNDHRLTRFRDIPIEVVSL